MNSPDPLAPAPGQGPLDEFRSLRVELALAAAGLGTSWVIAVQNPVPSWELDLTRWINDAPDAVAAAMWPVMQFGSLAGPFVVGAALAARRTWRPLAAATVAAGVAAWFAAKGLKEIVARERPGAFIETIDNRDGSGEGLGYPSGHSAVAAAIAVTAMVALPHRWRWLAATGAGLVGVARVVYGQHLPADVVGGWSLGALIGFGALALLQRFETRVY
ncbi:MAG: phosphatase PAP2 family protein [Actinomycetota bacterium]